MARVWPIPETPSALSSETVPLYTLDRGKLCALPGNQTVAGFTSNPVIYVRNVLVLESHEMSPDTNRSRKCSTKFTEPGLLKGYNGVCFHVCSAQ